jgi:uncharacterized RDD family membrane protein YckC
MFCPTCGQESLEQTNFCQSCGHPLHPEAQNRLISIAPYAGFWRRFAAYLLDGIIVFIIGTGADAVVGVFQGVDMGLAGGIKTGFRQAAGIALGMVIGSITTWLYWAGLESSAYQATLGKMALGLKVTDLHGEPIAFGRATGRFFGKFISAALLGIGFLMAGWTEKKQALHDIMAGTLVVRKPGGHETA